MKTLLATAILVVVLQTTLAGTTNIYVENWGTGNSGVTGDGNINTVGWTGIAVSQRAGPYLGIYTATGASDPGTGAALPPNTAYFTTLLPSQTAPGMFYTTDAAGAGAGGNSSFTDINPTQYTNLTLTAEVRGAATDTNYFAVQVGGSWYVATSYQMSSSGALGYPNFTNAMLVYTNPANVWNALAINASNVTIGAVAALNLSAPVTGIGIVELPTAGGFNYNQVTVSAFAPNPPPPTPATITATAITPQYAPVGGGASFLILAAGTKPLTYIWETNGVPIQNGGRYFGADTGTLTISNVNTSDALLTYSVIVTNIAGSATNSNLALNVQTLTPDILYSEAFPYVGPNGNLPISGVGWVAAATASTAVGIYQSGPGLGDVFSYSPSPATNAYYTTDTNDIGQSGLPFVDINLASYPTISFAANFVPGNAAGQVPGAISVYWAVQMNGAWYSSRQAIPITLTSLNPYLTNAVNFNPAVTNWNNLTISSNVVTIGGQISTPLTGNITGAGLVVVHHDSTGSDMNFQDFVISTNMAVGTAPSIGSTIPLAVGVPSGGGASFGVAATGTQPFTYSWTTNGGAVQNGGRASGANTATLTIAGLTAADNNMQVVAYVTNPYGSDNSAANFGATTLTVTNPPVGLLYSENFPFVGPVAQNYPISSIGWVESVPGTPNALYQQMGNTSQGAVFAYLGTPATTVYYTTTATDTNQSGLPFPNIAVAYYPDLTFSVSIAPQFAASNVTAYVAVQMNGSSWYVASSPLPVDNSSDSSAFSTYTQSFNSAAANWKNLTVTSSGGIIGSAASGNLKGAMTGFGLVFVTVNTGGTFNFNNVTITGSGLGGINVGRVSAGSSTMTWVGNPVVNLQSNTNLTTQNWLDVPNTSGAYSAVVPVTGPQKYFRLIEH
jgi:hypothetical protein